MQFILCIYCVTQSLPLLPRATLAHHNLHLPSSSNSHASAFQVAGITGARYHAQLILVFLVEMGFTMLARLVSNSWPKVICPLRPPKVLDCRKTLFLKSSYFQLMEKYSLNATSNHKVVLTPIAFSVSNYNEKGKLY